LVTFPAGNSSTRVAWLTHGGATVVIASAPGKFSPIDLITGKVVGPDLDYGGDFTVAEFAPHGRSLALGNDAGRLVLWKPPPVPPRKSMAAALDQKQLNELWQALAARWLLTTSPAQALVLFRNRLHTQEGDSARVAAWIAQLDSQSFKEREKATHELERIGDAFEPALRAVLEQPPTLEMRLRLQILLGKLAVPLSGERVQALRAIVILEAIGNHDARAILGTLAAGTPGSRITEAAQAALKRLKSTTETP
jgi:hypothetical protein